MDEISRIGRHDRRFLPLFQFESLRRKITERTAKITFEQRRRNLPFSEKQLFSAFDAYLPVTFFQIIVTFGNAELFQCRIQGGILAAGILAAALEFVFPNQ